MNDPLGEAIHDYLKKGKAPDIVINSNYTADEHISVSYLFRDEKQMPSLEKTALRLCRGKILDIGAAAGCHSLILQKKGFNVTALDISKLSVDCMRRRGIQKVVHDDIYSYSEQKYDTLLLLMNGTGIGRTLEGLKKLLLHLKGLLNSNGQILIDSSDIKYLFEEDDGSRWIDLNNKNYYGEMKYEVSYKKHSAKFDWLFVDFNTLQEIASEVNLNSKMIQKGENFDFLARLK